jgi:DNA repair exonuclease SbcCD nuclease subunit
MWTGDVSGGVDPMRTGTGVRFIHTADWQLGMPANFLEPEARYRFQQARFDVIAKIGEVARAERAAFVVVAGDVFEYNLLAPKTIQRALDAMAQIPVPVLLLPGNHDPLDATSIFSNPHFRGGCPPNVHVLDQDGVREDLEEVLPPGVEVVAAPWRTKHPARNPLDPVLEALDAAPVRLRVAVGHGGMDVVGGRDDVDILRLADLERALADGRVHYIALGDRHSTTPLGRAGRIWYAGAPEVTAFDEVDPGNVLVVDLDVGGAAVRPVRVGTWRFQEERRVFGGAADVAAFSAWLRDLDQKDRTAVRLAVSGALPMAARRELDTAVESVGASLAGLRLLPADGGLRVRAEDDDLAALPPGSFARTVADELRRRMADGEAPEVAEAALTLLLRLEAEA